MGNRLLDTECNIEGGRKEIKPYETKQGVHRKIGHFQKFANKRKIDQSVENDILSFF